MHHTFPLDAEYEFSVAGGIGPIGFGGATLDVTLDGEQVVATNPRGFRVAITAGPHAIGAALVDRVRSAGVDEAYSDFRNNAVFTPPGGVQSITVIGPFHATGVGDTPSRRQIFTCRPSNPRDEPACVRRILAALGRRAYRRPLQDSDLETLTGFYRAARRDSDFESGIQSGIRPGDTYRLSPIELASRLSFLLWSSIPDEELLDLATDGRLVSPAVLIQQVKRMLADPKADALTRNFAGQWLSLRDLSSLQTGAKDFDDNLRQAFRRETELLFSTIVREDRSLLDLLDADYTFVDERLARHYGIPNIHGSYFRRIALDEASPRRGLFGQGSMLTVTSVATRTSPVSRGKWILENILGTPAPVPPPGTDTNLEKDPVAVKATSIRQRLEAHRSTAVCASCHRIMDPIGFALENFDLIGAWREVDGRTPIDASGQLVDGTPLHGPADLRHTLLTRSAAFVTNATERLFTYALGRPVQYDDMPAVRAVVHRAARDDYRFSSLILGVVESPSFQMKIKR